MITMIIKNGYIVDPGNKREGVFDILIQGRKIVSVEKDIKAKDANVIDATGKIVLPGLIDMHVHLREPGRENMETVLSGTRAAVAGGVTSVCSMPNTYPAIDNQKALKELKDIIKKDASSYVFMVGAITVNRGGKVLVDIEKMKAAGAIALSDDGSSVHDSAVMASALKKAKENDILIISHCENEELSKGGVVNEGIMATKLGLKGIPKRAEYEIIERDIMLAKKAKARIHIAHVSTKESVAIIRKAKKEGARVTAETAPHYFSLTDTCCETYDTRTKMNPPLRSKEDLEAIKKGLLDGTIDAIASDHAPHGKHEKEITFDEAAFGIIGLETSLALAIMGLAKGEKAPWMKIAELMSLNPARILGLKKGAISEGWDADITIVDPEKEWVYTKESVVSKSKNSPFLDWQFKGKPTGAIVGGRLVLRDEKFA
ncbi:MAG: dihydroorotase [Candidatus Omnitrophota bacterium]